MATVKTQLVDLQCDANMLLSYAKTQDSTSSELISEIDSLKYDIGSSLCDYHNATQNAVDELRYEFDRLQSELSRAIGSAAMMVHKGQLVQAEAIRKAGHDVGGAISGLGGEVMIGGVMGGAIAGLLGLAAATVGGEIIGRAIKSKKTNDDLKRDAMISLIKHLSERKPFLTFKYIVDAASSQNTGIMSAQDARMHLGLMIEDGIVRTYKHGNLRALRLVNEQEND